MLNHDDLSRKASFFLCLILLFSVAMPSSANARQSLTKKDNFVFRDKVFTNVEFDLSYSGLITAEKSLTNAAANFKKELTAAFKANPKSVAIIKAVYVAHKNVQGLQISVTKSKKALDDAKADANRVETGGDPSRAAQPSATPSTADACGSPGQVSKIEDCTFMMDGFVKKLDAAKIDLTLKVKAAKKDSLIVAVIKYAKNFRFLKPKDYLPDSGTSGIPFEGVNGLAILIDVD
jgi:hypothetical protein